jgi:hypothetical protein
MSARKYGACPEWQQAASLHLGWTLIVALDHPKTHTVSWNALCSLDQHAAASWSLVETFSPQIHAAPVAASWRFHMLCVGYFSMAQDYLGSLGYCKMLLLQSESRHCSGEQPARTLKTQTRFLER